jgi:hypothetical protein
MYRAIVMLIGLVALMERVNFWYFVSLFEETWYYGGVRRKQSLYQLQRQSIGLCLCV